VISKSKKLPTGTYFYKLQFKHEENEAYITCKGYLYLMHKSMINSTKKYSVNLIVLGFSFLLLGQVSYGQQEAQFTQFIHSIQSYNPAYVGLDGEKRFSGPLQSTMDWYRRSTKDPSD
jgi:hypothetical protein